MLINLLKLLYLKLLGGALKLICGPKKTAFQNSLKRKGERLWAKILEF